MHLRPHSAPDSAGVELLGLARETVRSERNRASFPGLHRLPYDSWMRACTSGRGMWFLARERFVCNRQASYPKANTD